MGTYIWNGESLSARTGASVDIEDRGFNFGDGIYEVFRIYGGKLFEAEAHWARLIRSVAEIRIELPYSAERLSGGIAELVKADGVTDGIVYLQVTRGAAPRSHAFPAPAPRPTITAFTNPLDRPVKAIREGVAVVTHPDIRWLRCDIKSLNLLPNVLAKQAASEAGAWEAILHRDRIVTEGSSSNVAIVRDGVILTHPANHLILHGITRAVAIRLANGLGIPLREAAFTLEELYAADEAFLLSTTAEIMPIIAVDGRPIGSGSPGAISRALQAEFERLIL
ncbi:D-amino-acid transaminase [Paenibacillus thermotolerans]|uniref:D-amino-acid transaminase n=1 Tax=Paenibacillus thermotolerans TaxID=3027807 RepID=UPI0023686071|nr:MULTISPECIES: D-amino-acid transaminase [unclassified Paenibacillus]